MVAGERRFADVAGRAVLGTRTRTLGRDRELQLLIGLIEECGAQSVSAAAVVTGAVGVGASRLCDELLLRVAALPAPPRVWRGAGDPLGTRAPFGLLASTLRERCGIRGALVTPADREGALAALRDACLRGAEEFLAELIGAPLAAGHSPALAAARQEPRLMCAQLRRAWLDAIAGDVADGPVVVMIDDLHFGDASSIAVVDEALRAERPFTVVAFARPDVTDVFPELWAHRRLARVYLGPLAREAAIILAGTVLGTTAHPDRIERMIELAGGNVFHLEQLIRATAAGVPAPATLAAAIERRLAALTPAARTVLRAASVLGTRVRRGGVAALTDDPVGLDGALDELVASELLMPGPGDELVFDHELVRDAAHGELSAHDRAALHRRAGRWLELQRARDAAAIAAHLDRGGDRDRATLWHRYAAEQALDAGDGPAVREHARRGLGTAAGAEAAHFQLLIAEASDWMDDVAVSEEAAIDAMDLAPAGSTTWLRAAGALARMARRRGDRGLFASIARHLLQLPAIDDLTAFVTAASHTACALLAAGHRDLGAQIVIRIETAARGHGSSLAEGWRLRALAAEASARGDPADCQRLSERSAVAFAAVDAVATEDGWLTVAEREPSPEDTLSGN